MTVTALDQDVEIVIRRNPARGRLSDPRRRGLSAAVDAEHAGPGSSAATNGVFAH